jgi:prepilin-type N-terminal cleavage/methylation domain-containing protein/prepilin-type processing-associated H-X9-DG protein
MHGSSSRPAFSLIELLVSIAIVALLIALLMPGLAAARESANRSICLNNLRQTAVAAHCYALDEQGWFPYGLYSPGGLDWPLLFRGYMPGIDHAKPGTLSCPTYLRQELGRAWWGNFTYTWNRHTGFYPHDGINENFGVRPRDLADPSAKSFIIDGLYRGDPPLRAPPDRVLYAYDYQGLVSVNLNAVYNLMNHHAGQSNNLGFFDGHAQNLPGEAIEPRAADLWNLRQP